MKKYILICVALLLGVLYAAAQNPFIRDQESIYLKVTTDKVGIGVAPGASKVTIGSVAGEIPLSLKGYSSPYNPYLALYSSNNVAIWKLYANPNWFTIGNSSDTTTALLVGKISKLWMKINGTLSLPAVISTAATLGTANITTATIGTTTATKSTADTAIATVATIGKVTATKSTADTTIATISTLGTATATSVNTGVFEATDTTGIILSNAAGTRYRIFVTASGAVSITALQ